MNTDPNMARHQDIIYQEMQLRAEQVAAVETLLDDGGTGKRLLRYWKTPTVPGLLQFLMSGEGLL